MDKSAGLVGGENRWPMQLDTKDPEAVAEFTLSLGYAADDVVNTLVKRCTLDRITARRIVDAAVLNKGGPR